MAEIPKNNNDSEQKFLEPKQTQQAVALRENEKESGLSETVKKEALIKEVEEMETIVREQFPEYKEFLPQYVLVEKIPDYKEREDGKKYFNSEDLMLRIKHIDLRRILEGETTITSTPVAFFSKEDLEKSIEDEFLQGFLKGGSSGTFKGDMGVAQRNQMIRLACRYGSYSIGTNQIEIIDIDSLGLSPKIMELIKSVRKNNDHELTYIHEDVHAYICNSSEREKSCAKAFRENELLEARIAELQEEYHKKVDSLFDEELKTRRETQDEFFERRTREEAIDEMVKIKKEIQDTNEYLLELNQEITRLIDRQIDLMESLGSREKAVAVQEGLTFAVENYYADKFNRKGIDSFGGYNERTTPEDIIRAKQICERIICLIGVDEAKKIVVSVLDRDYTDEEEPIDRLQQELDARLNSGHENQKK